MAQKGFETTPVGTDGDPLVDDVNDAVRVNVVAGGAGGGVVDQGVAAASTAGWPVTQGTVAVSSAAWTNATALNSAVSIAVTGYGSVVISNTVSGTVSSGTLTFESSDDGGTTWTTAIGVRTDSAGNTVNNAVSATASSAWSFAVAGLTNFRVRLSVVIGGTGTATIRAQASAAARTPYVNVGGSVSAGVTSLPTLILSTSTAQIGRVIIDTGSTVSANITNASIPVTQSGAWVFSTSSGNPAFVSVTNGGGGSTSVDANVTNASIPVEQSGTWVISTASGNPAFVTQTATSIAAAQSGVWVVSTASGNPAFVTQTATSIAASQSGVWVVSTSSSNPAFVRINDHGNIANVTNITTGGGINGTLLVETGGRWSVTANPGVAAAATASRSSAGSGIRHVADTVIFSANSTAAVAAATRLTFNLRDGATGAGTVLATWTYVMSSTPAVQNTGPQTFRGLCIIGTANTAMTFECTSTIAAISATVTLVGYDIS